MRVYRWSLRRGMWWNEKDRKWEKHPMCRCRRDPCICANLPPLDEKGRPIGKYGVLGPDWPAAQSRKEE
jgi:hypothetical protein